MPWRGVIVRCSLPSEVGALVGVHGAVGLGEELGRVDRDRRGRVADAHTDGHLMAGDLHGLGDHLSQAFGDRLDRGSVGSWKNHGELVAP